MMRMFTSLALAAALCLSPAALQAQQPPKAKAAAPKVAKDEKVCRYKFPTGESRVWVCKKVEPCCAWDAIKYVKCGSTITGCL
ncbi:MAG: hypothetical protein F9K29_16860 [Hyphomicrobiaceae bacterium]|nr:MAG: hypothetical protein F9K29_16860 [Hyphomicrobiaceae bacterium]